MGIRKNGQKNEEEWAKCHLHGDQYIRIKGEHHRPPLQYLG